MDSTNDTLFGPPQRTNRPPETVTLTGLLFPWRNGQPVLLNVFGSPSLHLFCFKEKSNLLDICARAGASFDTVKQIDDGPEFLSSVPDEIVIALNPHFTPEGKIRYTQVQRSSS